MEQLRRHDQKSLLLAGERLTIEEAEKLKISLGDGIESLSDRIKLIGYYLKKHKHESTYFRPAPSELFEQSCWIVRNSFDMPMFNGVESAYLFFDSDQAFDIYKILLDALDRCAHTEDVLHNALAVLENACTGKDHELRNQLRRELDEKFPRKVIGQ